MGVFEVVFSFVKDLPESYAASLGAWEHKAIVLYVQWIEILRGNDARTNFVYYCLHYRFENSDSDRYFCVQISNMSLVMSLVFVWL